MQQPQFYYVGGGGPPTLSRRVNQRNSTAVMVWRGARAAQQRRGLCGVFDYSVSFQFLFLPWGAVLLASTTRRRRPAPRPGTGRRRRALPTHATTLDSDWRAADPTATTAQIMHIAIDDIDATMPGHVGRDGRRRGSRIWALGSRSHHHTSPLRAPLKPCQEGAWPCDQGTTHRAHPFFSASADSSYSPWRRSLARPPGDKVLHATDASCPVALAVADQQLLPLSYTLLGADEHPLTHFACGVTP